MTLRDLASARLRVSRRGVLRLGGYASVAFSGWAVGEAASRLIVDPLVEKPARAFHSTELDETDFERMASPAQRAALAAWNARGLANSPEISQGRCTIAERRDGEMWVVSQGLETARLLWRRRPPIGIPMSKQPDAEFGAWRGHALASCADRARPVFELIRTVVEGADGSVAPQRYTALLLPDGERVASLSADLPQIAPRPLPPGPPTSRQADV